MRYKKMYACQHFLHRIVIRNVPFHEKVFWWTPPTRLARYECSRTQLKRYMVPLHTDVLQFQVLSQQSNRIGEGIVHNPRCLPLRLRSTKNLATVVCDCKKQRRSDLINCSPVLQQSSAIVRTTLKQIDRDDFDEAFGSPSFRVFRRNGGQGQ